MTKSFFAALIASTSLLASPALAQEATAEPIQLSAEEVAAQNQAVADFTEAQNLLNAGDNAGALAKIEAALPTIRQIAARDAANVQNAGFLASALTMASNAQGALGNMDAIAPLYAEAVPQWRKVYDADPTNAGVRDTMISMMINLGNFNLIQQNKEVALPIFTDALSLVQTARQADATSPVLANAEFSALIGLNQSTGDPAYIEQAKPVGEELRSKGIVNAANKPSVDAILGAA
ncbi:MAG: hypothetical protein R3E02_15785 [Blastomonas sp.]